MYHAAFLCKSAKQHKHTIEKYTTQVNYMYAQVYSHYSQIRNTKNLASLIITNSE